MDKNCTDQDRIAHYVNLVNAISQMRHSIIEAEDRICEYEILLRSHGKRLRKSGWNFDGEKQTWVKS